LIGHRRDYRLIQPDRRRMTRSIYSTGGTNEICSCNASRFPQLTRRHGTRRQYRHRVRRAAAPPDMLLQSANLSDSGNTLNVTRVPVRDSTGKITYKDIELTFDISNTGVVTLGPGSPVVTTSPSLNVAGFRAGIYKDTDKRHY
jgi:hypothetical protein